MSLTREFDRDAVVAAGGWAARRRAIERWGRGGQRPGTRPDMLLRLALADHLIRGCFLSSFCHYPLFRYVGKEMCPLSNVWQNAASCTRWEKRRWI